MPDLLHIDRRDHVAVVTLSNPEKRNVLSAALVAELSATLRDVQRDRQVRSVVLTGELHFCSGGDLDGMASDLLDMRRTISTGQNVARQLICGPLPIVAAVNGNAYGAGFSLALACDFVVGDENTVFCAAFGKVGLIPDSGLIWTLPQRVGIGRAREIMMLCEPIKGEQAHRLGLIDHYCAPGRALETAIGLATRLADASPGAVQATKAMLARLPLSFDAVLAWEVDAQPLLLGGDDFKEGVSAFRDRRSPRFAG